MLVCFYFLSLYSKILKSHFIKLRGLVKLCLNVNPLERPNIQEILKLADQMYTHFQSIANFAPNTPSPMEMQQSLKQ
jgi:hypothetical protein